MARVERLTTSPLVVCPSCGRELPPLYGDHPNGPCHAVGARHRYRVTTVYLADGRRVDGKPFVVSAEHLLTHIATMMESGTIAELVLVAI